MKLYLTLALGLLTSLAPLAQAQESNTLPVLRADPPSCDQGDASCVIMTQDQSVDLAEFGAINFIGIPEDSRCPIDAVCVWAGRVRVELKYDASASTEKFEVGLGGDLKPQWTDSRTGLVLSLQQVWPEKELAIESQEPYRIKLKVEPATTNKAADGVQQDQAAQQNQTAQQDQTAQQEAPISNAEQAEQNTAL